MNSESVYIMSGIIDSRKDEVLSVIEKDFEVTEKEYLHFFLYVH